MIVDQTPDSCQSWQQDRLDLTEHFLTNVDFEQLRCAPAVAEDMVDLFFQIGRNLLSSGSHDMAVLWLKRASQLLGNQDIECLSSDAGQLRLNLLHTSGKLCVQLLTHIG